MFFAMLPAMLIAQEYQIYNVDYEIEGITKEYPLSQAVEIDTDRVFRNLDELIEYLTDLNIQFQNQRVLESAYISPFYGEPNENNIIPVDLLIQVVDSGNFIAAPYPRYDSNSGFTLKVASNHYNFLGSMQRLDFDLFYEWDNNETEGNTEDDEHSLGGYVAFSYPFQIGFIDASWTNAISLEYTIGHSMPQIDFSTGVGMYYRINDIFALSLSVTQGIDYNDDYEIYGDALYFTETASLSAPVTLAQTPYIGNLVWTPSLSVVDYLDMDGISPLNPDLSDDTELTVGHAFTFGRVNWVGNYREGFSFSFGQQITPSIFENTFTFFSYMNGSYYKAFKYAGFNTRWYYFHIYNSTSEVGANIRGVINSLVDTDSALLLNFDIPIKIWQTDWVGYGLWDWTRYFDFELQLVPFIDIGIGNNPNTGSVFDYKDGWYGAGLEVLGFLSASRSIVGRISVGVDIVQFADKVGNRIDFVDTVVHKIFNTDWRGGSWYEFAFGIGLFY
ncbi:MAG: hypothetical protein R3Y36_01415 [Spirochaetales bacterium]